MSAYTATIMRLHDPENTPSPIYSMGWTRHFEEYRTPRELLASLHLHEPSDFLVAIWAENRPRFNKVQKLRLSEDGIEVIS